jgi:aryl-alcohol dehydrogenase-like predicted oxidoreductase
MIYRRMGRTGLQVSLLSLGSGGYNLFGQSKGVPESEIHRLVRHALDVGVNHFDTAARPSYGDSELILGRALTGIPRDRYTLSTKFPAVDADTGEIISGARVVQYIEDSLSNMKIDELDILLLAGDFKREHYPRVVEELLPTLERLLQDGKIKHLGSSEHSVLDGSHEWLSRALEDNLLEVVMVAYNMMNQSAEQTIFPQCREKDVGAMGIFTVRNVFSVAQRLQEVVADLKSNGLLEENALPGKDPLGWLLDDEDPSLVAAAYRFSAGNDAISTIMCGTIDIDHLDANIKALEKGPLAPDKQARLRELFGHLKDPIGN